MPTTVSEYLNNPDVRSKFHVSPDGVKNYSTRSSPVYQNFQPAIEGSGWAYDLLLKLGYRVLHIMGTTDGVETVPSMWKWINARKQPVTQPWTPYVLTSGNLFGYTKAYGNLTVLSVLGTGHDVLYTKSTDISRVVRRFTQERPI